MKTLFLVQARLGSSRFPGKLLVNLMDDLTLIDIQLDRLLLSPFITRENLFILTTDQSKDDRLSGYLTDRQFHVYRGPENDVYQRYISFLLERGEKCDYICRICADNPFIEPEFIAQLLEAADQSVKPIDYISFRNLNGQPTILTHYGFFTELIHYDVFLSAQKLDLTPYQREHVTPVFYASQYYTPYLLPIPEILNKYRIRLTIDTEDDAAIAQRILHSLGTLKFNYLDLLDYLDSNPDVLEEMTSNIEKNKK